ncbi:MAG: NADH-quinone oxidoreductase subunit D [Actinomycetota bacterium]|nr:NADH-quinone oxidoreductase subunit D [Actinomycetota bacterium]
MKVLLPLAVAIPMSAAALLLAAPQSWDRRAFDAFAIAIGGSVTVICAVLLGDSTHGSSVYWFGDWIPKHGVALGLAFVAEPIALTLATLAAFLVTASLIYSWHYFDTVGNLFHVLLLSFLGAMVGFCLTGDLFTLFVFSELISVVAFSLAGYKIEEEGSLQGALNFAVSNSIGASLILSGIALLYGRTGALNMAQIGESLAGGSADGLVVTAFAFLVAGYFIKAAVVPFHFWLADSYAAAPTPACVLFAGVLCELSLYAIARVYWTVFDGVLGGGLVGLRSVMVGAGAVTAILGALMCWPQRHIKRLLAFSTVSHVGMFLLGVGLFSPVAFAGTVVYLVTDGLVKGSLFFCAGILLHRLGSVDELGCDGVGRSIPYTGFLFLLGGLGLAGLPPFGTFVGKALIGEEAARLGYPWVTYLIVAASVLTAGPVLRAGARVFWGLGPGEAYDHHSEAEGDEGEPETSEARDTTPPLMWTTAAILLGVSLVAGLIPDLSVRFEPAADLFLDRDAYADLVLRNVTPHHAPLPSGAPLLEGALIGTVSAVCAAVAAALGLWHARLPSTITGLFTRSLGPPFAILRGLHSGHVGDYVAWATAGVALLGGLLTFTLR